MSSLSNTEIVRRVWEDGLNRREHAVFDELVGADYVNHESAALGIEASGPADWTQVLARLGASFPDVSWRILRTIAEGDQVWIETAMSGTHQGEVFGYAPTGRRFEVRQVHILRVEGGQIREHRAVRDDLGILIQLGLVDASLPRQSAARA